MSPHIANDVPRLLTGEATREEVLTAAAHLRTCVDCQQELVSAVVAHASLTSAQRFAPEIVAGLPRDLLAPRADPDRDDAPAPQLPDLSAVFSQVREEAAQPRRRPRRLRGKYVAAAAAVVVLAGGGAAVGYVAASSGSSSPTRTVRLAAFDQGGTNGTATMSGTDQMRVDAAGLPQVRGKRYEVWLTNAARTQMQPVGWLGPDDQAAMTVPSDLLDRFDHIEISVQPVDSSSYDYSGTSVLRGGYA
jgi:hypothetical protein